MDGVGEEDKPSVEIIRCISYQKFRYSGENRPGKKYQEKGFMDLKLNNLAEKVVRIIIICTDADNNELIHPNGLVGKDCHDGIYDKEYPLHKTEEIVKIPYLRTERIKTKKNEHAKIRNILKSRADHLPSPYRERCASQCKNEYTLDRKFDTTKVCLGVIVTVKSYNFQGTVNGSLHAISNVVHNASEKTALGILKLNRNVISASEGGFIDVFTTEDGPAIEEGKYMLYVTYPGKEKNCLYDTDKFLPEKPDILYKRIITYRVPPLCYELAESPIEAVLHLECPQSRESCEHPFYYSIHEDQEDFYIESDNLKRTSSTEILDEIRSPKKSLAVKAALKDSLQKTVIPALEIIEASADPNLILQTEPRTSYQSNTIVYGPNESFHSSSNGQNGQNLTVLTPFNKSVHKVNVSVNKEMSYFQQSSQDGEHHKAYTLSSEYSVKEIKQTSSPITIPNSVVIVNDGSNDVIYVKDDATSVKNHHLSVKSSTTPEIHKKMQIADSPWSSAVSDDESDEAENLFRDLIVKPRLKRKSCDANQSSKLSLSENDRDSNVPPEKLRKITVLSNNVDSRLSYIHTNTDSSIKSDNVNSLHLDFSNVNYLPSDLNSEYLISKMGLIDKD